MSEEQKKKYRLLDNKTGEAAMWDFNALAVELVDLDFDGFDFGFDELLDDEGYGTDFTLADGDRAPVQNMTFTFSDTEADVVREAIAEMKQTQDFKEYDNPYNKNSNGNALFMVVSEWLQQRI